MSNRTRRKYTSAGQRKQPSKAGLPPKFARGAWPERAETFRLHLISVGRRQPCAECNVEITPGDRAAHNRDDGALYHLDCMSLRILHPAAGRPADQCKRVAQRICRLYEVETPDALPYAVRAATLALID
jgi:hypothetical protein